MLLGIYRGCYYISGLYIRVCLGETFLDIGLKYRGCLVGRLVFEWLSVIVKSVHRGCEVWLRLFV